MSEPLYQIRSYSGGADFHMVADWWRAHGRGEFLETLLPPDGWIVQRDGEDVAAAWLYLSAGIGVAFLEWSCAKPGQSLAEAREAFGHLIEFMRGYAAKSNYGVIWANTLPGIARVLSSNGFTELDREKVAMILQTQ